MPENRQRTRSSKIQECALAFSLIEEAIKRQSRFNDIPLTPASVATPIASQETKLVSPKQVSQKLGISEKTLANWRCSGTQGLSHIKVGSRIFYRSSDVHAFINNNSKTSTSQTGG